MFSMRVFVLIILSILLFAWIVFFFKHDTAKNSVAPIPIDTHSMHLEKPNVEEENYVAMQAEYKKLKKERWHMERQLADIKALMWSLKLPTDQARNIMKTIKKGYALLKFKKLFGAFSSVTDINDEVEQVMYINDALQDIIIQIKIARKKAAEQGMQ